MTATSTCTLKLAPTVAAVVLLVFTSIAAAQSPAPDAKAPAADQPTFTLKAIGHVQRADGKTRIILEKQYQPGLLGMEKWSHVMVVWWFDKNDTPQRRAILQVHPRGNRENPLTGVFATRSPVRPNLIALTCCKIQSVTDNVIEIDSIDAFDGTPVIDLKPYVPHFDAAENATSPDWAK